MPRNSCRPETNASSLMASVEATKAPARTEPSRVITTPLGLTRNTRPLAVRLPAISEAPCPVTRLSMDEEAEGWRTSTLPPAPIEKPSQFTIAASVPCRIAIRPVAGVATSTEPWTTLGPVGSSWAAPGAVSAVPAISPQARPLARAVVARSRMVRPPPSRSGRCRGP